MKLIVGLGNPGEKYEGTRHNLGFAIVESFAARHEFAGWSASEKIKGEICRGAIGKEKIILLKPATFMNLSGQAVAAALSFFKLKPADLIVAHDEMAFPLGTVRIGQNRSSGGHNGVASVIEAIGSTDFVRLRIGIGPKNNEPVTLDAYVLKRFPKTEVKDAAMAVTKATEALDKLIQSGYAAATQEINSR